MAWSLAALAGTGSGNAPAQPASPGRLVVVFLRGALDGLSAFVPYADPHYGTLRPTIAIGRPDGTDQTALALDATFALHPALAPLYPLWQQGVFSFVPAAGLPAPLRSHFEAQHLWETGRIGRVESASGWLNTLAGLRSRDPRHPALVGVGEANPTLLAGPAPQRLVPKGQAATRTGVLEKPATRDALMDLYAQSERLGPAFRRGADSRVATARTLAQGDDTANTQAMGMAMPMAPDMLAANNGAGAPSSLLVDAGHLATLMREDRGLTLGFLSTGGWDTHANQGNAQGQLARNLGNLATALAQLRAAFREPGDVIAVVSEFGRTCAENGTRGTDHGFGNAIWLLGNRIHGGRWHGQWEGLAPDRLNEQRDLPAFHDYRAVLSLVLQGTQNVNDTQLAALFPGSPYAGSALTRGVNAPLSALLRPA
jgi:uncharacterized protein (DUF1501 family)